MIRRQNFSTSYGNFTIDREGTGGTSLRDVYALILAMRWRNLFSAFLLVYFATNAFFAGLFVLGGDCIQKRAWLSALDA
ncbi:MAG: hypothetical protein AAFX94_02115, partial [Myxococcota bacterium]